MFDELETFIKDALKPCIANYMHDAMNNKINKKLSTYPTTTITKSKIFHPFRR